MTGSTQSRATKAVYWHLATVLAAVAMYSLWWALWQGIVGLLPESFFGLPDSVLGAFVNLGGPVLWAILAVLAASVVAWATRRWVPPSYPWAGVAAVGVVIAAMWLSTVLGFETGLDAILDSVRLGLVPPAAMLIAAWVGARRGRRMRECDSALLRTPEQALPAE